jgi:REP element-mobilizing transposase RayT
MDINQTQFDGHRPPLQTPHKPRLSRLPRLFAGVPVFFVTACAHQRQRLLANQELHNAFRKFTHKATDYGVFVGRYVLMPDHIHLFVSLAPEALSLSDWMKSLKNCLSKTIRNQRISPPHWQKGFFDHVLRSDESLA